MTTGSKKASAAPKMKAKKPAAAPVKEPAVSSGGGLSVLDRYDVPAIEQDNWGLWLEPLEDGPKSVVGALKSELGDRLEWDGKSASVIRVRLQ